MPAMLPQGLYATNAELRYYAGYATAPFTLRRLVLYAIQDAFIRDTLTFSSNIFHVDCARRATMLKIATRYCH